ncbi:MAG: TRASH domain-containing protein [archaeon GB-1867-035]|nr:TRASH domain-containing protein [Candidatus Culexmicrobium profundum]
MKLDEIDNAILRVLLSNARASISDIAREVGISRPTARKRIQRLLSSGLIKGFSAIIDESLLKGFQVVCWIKASDAEKIASELEKINEVTRVYVTSGERNIICIARIPDMMSLESLINKLSSYNLPFELSIVLKSISKPIFPEFLSILKLKCDYCGKEIVSKALTYTIHNRRFYFCCPTCLREFSKRLKSK